MGITLTENAAVEVKKVMDEQKMDDVLLRIGVAGGGCSGFSYSLGFDKAFDDEKDVKSEQHGINVVVDKKSELYLEGVTIDFYSGLEKRGFVFDNPNATKSCGCGSSFSV
ncbi:MAG: iron-sulfur cluster assembly accessory protein [Pirellulales bacterium]|nr:iron-sulfur cluster assembly accessory protein [Pirellulales bacterium]